jgi:hypothetical protein
LLSPQRKIQFFPFVLLIIISITLSQTGYGQADSVKTDTLQASALSSEIWYSAEDSIRVDMPQQIVYLYGKARVKFEDAELTAGYMEVSMEDNKVFARGVYDSAGNYTDKPIFNDGSDEITMREITYNMKTKRGLVKDVFVQDGESYIHMGTSKMQSNEEVHLLKGKYTTCNLEDPHFYFNLSKAIIIPDDKIVSGPVNLVIADVPTPLGLPFGFFPNKKRESKGIVIPIYGESPGLGFFLMNGGYYFPVGEKMDMQILGDIYSRGSWGLKNITRYNVRYKYRGDANLSYTQIQRSNREFPDFSVSREFFIRWNHTQDPKARPNSRFNASVNAGTTSNFRNNFNTSLNNYLSNTFQSNISYYAAIPNKPMNFSVNARHNQNNVNHIVNFTLPEFTYNVNRFFPFKKINTQGKKNPFIDFYQNLGITYSTNFKNDITIADSLININRFDRIFNSMRNGVRHNAAVSTTLKLAHGKFTFNPSATFTERWYFQTLNKTWDESSMYVVSDTVGGFSRVHEYTLNGALTTKLYGMYKSTGKKQTTLRHVLTPALTMQFRPDFSSNITGVFGPNDTSVVYSPYDIGIFGKPASGEIGSLGISVINNIEMKRKSSRDTVTGYTKITLIENFSVNANYNFMRDSLNFSSINLSGRTNLFKNIGIVYSGAIDPYIYNNGIITNELMISNGKGLGRFARNDIALSTRLRSKNKKNQTTSSQNNQADEETMRDINQNRNGYVDFTIPWTLNLNLVYRQLRSFSNGNDTLINSAALTFDGDFSLTKNWKVGIMSGYDFVQEKITPTEITVYRDLHCWEAQFRIIPFGILKSYSIQINVKSSLLQDLKLQRRRSWYDQP